MKRGYVRWKGSGARRYDKGNSVEHHGYEATIDKKDCLTCGLLNFYLTFAKQVPWVVESDAHEKSYPYMFAGIALSVQLTA